MNKNLGPVDRVVRLALAAVFFSAYFYFEGAERYYSVIGIYPFLTAMMSYCPLYKALGFSSNTVQKR